MNSSPSIKHLAEALCKFQGEVQAATKDSVNPHFRSSFASLAAYQSAATPILTKYGLSVLQGAEIVGERSVLTTRLMHVSGEWIEGSMVLMPIKNDPQALGSAQTYCRRYGYAAILGMVAEDDDGETAQGRGVQSRTVAQATNGNGAKTAQKVGNFSGF